MPSAAEQNYLKAIFILTRSGAPASTSGLAEYLGLRAASVSGMLNRLAGQAEALVNYRKHLGARLTDAGRRQAVQLLRKHRLIETWLCRDLGFGWDEVHCEAELLEHSMSDLLIERLALRLGNPEFDPHGDPIPRQDGSMPTREGIGVLDLDAGQSATVIRVQDSEAELLRYLGGMGVLPDANIRLLEKCPLVGLFECLSLTQRSC